MENLINGYSLLYEPEEPELEAVKKKLEEKVMERLRRRSRM